MGVSTALSTSVKGLPLNKWSCCCDWSKMPQDLWVEILCPLPEEELIRCKIICKAWYDLITNVCVPKIFKSIPVHGFCHLAVKRKDESKPFWTYLLYRPYGIYEKFVDRRGFKPFINGIKPVLVDVLGCCNGLLLCVRASNLQYYVFNPATKQSSAVPLYPESESKGRRFCFASLAFDPSKSLHFKVVCFDRVLPLTLHIFSSETCRWDVFSVPLKHPTVWQHEWVNNSVYLNGVLYLLSLSHHLVCIDIDQMKACAIDLPGKDMTFIGFIGASRGHIYYSNHDTDNIFIWKLEECSEAGRWILIHNICIRELTKNLLAYIMWDYRKYESFMPYAVHPTSSIIFIGIPRKIIEYDFGIHKVIGHFSKWDDTFIASGQSAFWPYRRCLVNVPSFEQKKYGSSSLYDLLEHEATQF